MNCPLRSSDIKDVEVSGQFLVKLSKAGIHDVWFGGSRVVAFVKTQARTDDSEAYRRDMNAPEISKNDFSRGNFKIYYSCVPLSYGYL
jgi:hypothetical protein